MYNTYTRCGKCQNCRDHVDVQRETKDLRFPTAPISGSNLKGKEIEKANKLVEISVIKKKATTRGKYNVQLSDYTDTDGLNFKFIHFY